jgi:hypothetical protein
MLSGNTGIRLAAGSGLVSLRIFKTVCIFKKGYIKYALKDSMIYSMYIHLKNNN